MTTGKDIPLELAIRLCDKIQTENKKKWFSLGKLQCWGCHKFSKGEVKKMCLSSNNGCNLVNERNNSQKEKK
jgi:hypothetical protein